MPQRRRRKNSRRRRNLKRLTLAVMCLLVVVTLGILSVTVFFNINDIKITGDTRYTSAEILKATGLEKGDNMYLISDKKLETKVAQKLPYINSITVKRVLPDKIELTVSQAEPDYAFEVSEGYLITSEYKALEVVEAVDKSVALVNCNVADYDIGEKIDLGDNDELFGKIKSAIESTGIEKITYMDFSNPSKIILKYDGRLTLELGSADNLETKFKKALQIIPSVEKDNGSNVVGVIKLQYTDSYFERTLENSSSSAQSQTQNSESEPTASKID